MYHYDGMVNVAYFTFSEVALNVLLLLQGMIQQNPQQARQVLVSNPQLTKALFQVRSLLTIRFSVSMGSSDREARSSH